MIGNSLFNVLLNRPLSELSVRRVRVDPAEPDPRPGRPVLALAPGVLDQLHELVGPPPRPLVGMRGDQAHDPLRAITIPPFPNRLMVESKPLTGRLDPVFHRPLDDGQPLLHAELGLRFDESLLWQVSPLVVSSCNQGSDS